MDKTADGKPITIGLVCYDNDLHVVQVVRARPKYSPGEATWYDVVEYRPGAPEHGMRRPMQDGSRLSTTFIDYHERRFTAPAPIPFANGLTYDD